MSKPPSIKLLLNIPGDLELAKYRNPAFYAYDMILCFLWLLQKSKIS